MRIYESCRACITCPQVGDAGRVVGIDHIKDLVDLSLSNTARSHGNLMKTNRLKYVVGDGRKGYSDGAPYDCIHVGAAAPTLPQPVSLFNHALYQPKFF